MFQGNKYTLSASILAADFSNLSENIKNLKEFGCNEIHYDVMDGKFVDEISMGPVVLESIVKDINLNFFFDLIFFAFLFFFGIIVCYQPFVCFLKSSKCINMKVFCMIF